MAKEIKHEPNGKKTATGGKPEYVDVSPNQLTYNQPIKRQQKTRTAAVKIEKPKEQSKDAKLSEAVLTLAQRVKRANIMRREEPKLKRGRQIAAKRFAKEGNLKARAEKLARRLVKKRFAGQRGYDYAKLGPSEKIAIDKIVDKKVQLVRRLAKRLYPVVRRKEALRFISMKKAQNFNPNPNALHPVVHTPGATPVNLVNSYQHIQEKKFPPVRRDKETKLPEKYTTGKPSTDAARAAQFKKQTKLPPEMAKPAPGDATAKTKESKYTKKAREMFGESDGPVVWSKGNYSIERIGKKFALYDGKKKTQEFSSLDQAKKIVEPLTEEIAGLKKKAEKSGISYGTLKKVYDRGMAAWRTGHRPGTTPQQWAFARVNSFITKGKTYHTADKDLREEVQLNEWYIDTASKYKPSRGDSIVTNNGGRVFGRVERVDETSVYFRNQHDNRIYRTEINNVTKIDHWDGTLNENHSPECVDYVEPKKKSLTKRIKSIKEAQRDADFEMQKYVDASGKTRYRKIRKIEAVDKEENK